MKIDDSWSVSPNKVLLDLDIDKLGWKHGDCFKVTNVDGQAMLVKLDEVGKFFQGHPVNKNTP